MSLAARSARRGGGGWQWVVPTVLLTCLGALPASAATQLKLAILAPQGSTWAKALEDFKDEVGKKTGGEVELKIYSGGRQGDEQEVLKKMGVGYLDGGGFSGIGLGAMVPSVRMLELPFVWKDDQEVERALAKLTPFYADKFDKAGYKLLGWAEGGFVQLFTTEPVRTIDELRKQKMWTWSGDPLSDALFKGFGIAPIPLALPNVLQSLQTGLINGAYGPPLLAVALQWQTKVKYVSEDRFTYAAAAIVVSKKAWESLGKHQALVAAVAEQRLAALRVKIREDNDAALKVMLQGGMQSIKISEQDQKKIRETAQEISKSLIGKLYSQEELDSFNKTRAGLSN